MLQSITHYGIHFFMPLLPIFLFYKKNWMFAYLIMLSAFFIDLDHLLATPIFDANRCSINFHPLHTYYALLIYVLLLFYKKTRILALGLVIHIFADYVDCLFM